MTVREAQRFFNDLCRDLDNPPVGQKPGDPRILDLPVVVMGPDGPLGMLEPGMGFVLQNNGDDTFEGPECFTMGVCVDFDDALDQLEAFPPLEEQLAKIPMANANAASWAALDVLEGCAADLDDRRPKAPAGPVPPV
jgi:hypothetical protein